MTTTNTVTGGPIAGAACCTVCCAATIVIHVMFLPCKGTCIVSLGVLPPTSLVCVLAFSSPTP